MTKSIAKINRSRLQRSFVGLHTLSNPTSEAWEECGHYYAGVEMSMDEVYDGPDDNGREAADIEGYASLGFDVTGSGEPAQNDQDAIDFYRSKFRGTKNFAVLIGDKLVLFRLTGSGDRWSDNRISIKSAIQYSMKLKGKFTITGHVDDYEIYTVDPQTVQVQNGRLAFTKK